MRKYNSELNVYDAAINRIRYILDEFESVYVSFSGGKDSGVMANLVAYVLREFYPSRKVGLYHMDYEGQYQHTTDYVTGFIENNKDVFNVYWVCVPVKAQCSVSMYQDGWIPWNQEEKDIWCRDMPDDESVINEYNHTFDFFYHGMSDYEFNEKFHEWYRVNDNAEKSACLVGIRTQESLHRYKALFGKAKMYKGLRYFSEGKNKKLWNCYPIYDWLVDDIWISNSKFNWSYNRLYDLFYQSGMEFNNMRVASPFNDCAASTLQLYKAIEPNTWGRLVGRVNGANFAAIYGNTKAFAFRSISLPEGHTWKTYCEFLLSTLPENISDIYKKKFAKSHDYWLVGGGAVSLETASELIERYPEIVKLLGRPTNNRKYTFDKEVVIFSEYPDDLNISNFVEVPTYKRMCITILKNDTSCKYMGFGQTKEELQKRRNAEVKYKNCAGEH
jgi:predicted phosphoadenosine phosphosulfate sulfurtransferase